MSAASRRGAARSGATASPGLPGGDLALVLVLRAAALGGVWVAGFRSVSDDDFSRVVIAQQFAATPALDPSGTSWLPLPFWLTGAGMLVGGTSLTAARVVAVSTALASAGVLLAAARTLGVTRGAALLGAGLAALLPYAARLGVATVPDGYTATLLLFAAASTASAHLPTRHLGALAATAAALCRYEAWPVAFVVAALAAADGIRAREPRWIPVSALALLGPVAWMTHGALAHHDPWFFVGRVSAYRAALGESATGPITAVASLLWALLRLEPELSLLAAVAAIALALRRQPLGTGRYGRVALCLGTVLVFVAAGEARNAAPTHHPERALLSLWLALAIATGDGLWRAGAELRARSRAVLLGLATLAAAVGALGLRARWGSPEPFVDRREELAIGARAGALIPRRERLAIDTDDYGYFAVMAAFGRPGESSPLDDRDPRRRPTADAFSSPAALRTRLASVGARWVVTTSAHAPIAAAIGTERDRSGELRLVEVAPGP